MLYAIGSFDEYGMNINRKKLLSVSDLTLQEAIEISTASKDAVELQRTGPTLSTN